MGPTVPRVELHSPFFSLLSTPVGEDCAGAVRFAPDELGWVEVDTAGVAFCREGGRPNGGHGVVSFAENYGFIYQATMVDCPLPVEVHRDTLGQVVAARMCFTTDVDVLDGNWREIGALELSHGRCVACDPDCEGPAYRMTFDVKPGRYSASVSDSSNPDGSRDVLGLRITWMQGT